MKKETEFGDGLHIKYDELSDKFTLFDKQMFDDYVRQGQKWLAESRAHRLSFTSHDVILYLINQPGLKKHLLKQAKKDD